MDEVLKCEHSIYPLQLVIHAVQDRHAGEHGTQWDRNKKKKKELTSFKMLTSFARF